MSEDQFLWVRPPGKLKLHARKRITAHFIETWCGQYMQNAVVSRHSAVAKCLTCVKALLAASVEQQEGE